MNYSQNSEQDIILNYFSDRKGTFLDLGANDGVTLSNTRALAEIGWSGVLVEASPKAYAKLKDNYASLKVTSHPGTPDKPHISNFDRYNIAIGTTNGIMKFKESGTLLGSGDVALVSTFHDSEMDRFKSVVEYEEIEVKCLTWKAFMEGCPVKYFDFISMDIEGSELDVLPHMDLSNTLMICIEWNSKEDLKREYEKYLYGFKLIYTSAENLIYAR
jgi:FkbM family methyltransferase